METLGAATVLGLALLTTAAGCSWQPGSTTVECGLWGCAASGSASVAVPPDPIVEGLVDAGSTCGPPAALSFTSVSVGILQEDACSASSIQAIVDDCLGPSASDSACSADQTQYATCASCMLSGFGGPSSTSPPAQGPWGPLIVVGPFVYPNAMGCVALADSAYGSCAAAATEQLECEMAACTCALGTSVSSEETATTLEACSQSADDTVCASEAASSSAACAVVPDAGPTNAPFCNDPNLLSDEDNLVAFVGLFCAAGAPLDAGVD
jgi:hypothetical protein